MPEQTTTVPLQGGTPGNVGMCVCEPGRCTALRPDPTQTSCLGCLRHGTENGCLQEHLGATATCRTCREPITFETINEPGYLPRTGWSDGARRDALVCFRALNYNHVPDWVPTDEARR